MDVIHSNTVKHTTELAILSIIKMISEITRSYPLQKYKNNKNLQARIPNYMGVKMGFGLHVGWSIEGPIGSEYKIDASYLSPHVHMASRLEAATKSYGAHVLITGEVQKLMSKQNQHFLRQVDRVISNGEE
jgi:class 3 adenylate cyclase